MRLKVRSFLGIFVLCAIVLGCISGGYSPSGSLYFFYVPNFGNTNFSVFSMDSGSGNLTAISGSPFPAGAAPSSAAVDPSGQFLFIVNHAGGTIQSFTINPVTGAPTSVGTISNSNGPYVASADPNGNFVYVVNSGSANCM